ncbi:MAG TPA: tripartite tricarboxylate transporter TctB family protein [Xanthobacteraceae bacterium]|nr:tripartite tricarboxylate transporter TctB family protein [Xanthobacteraceae bacterium]
MKRARISAEAGPGHRTVEIGVALAMIAFAVIVIIGSIQAGIDWGAEGPRAGFFPFYIALFILVASMVNLFSVIIDMPAGKLFAEWGQLLRVLSVIIPTAVFVGIIPTLGIYVSSTMLIALFMKWLGKYRWPIVALIAVGVPVATFLVFEKWFLVPLPKGPVEEMLGF